MKETIWYKGKNGKFYMYEELKLVYLKENSKERFELCNFLSWIDKKGFVRIN